MGIRLVVRNFRAVRNVDIELGKVLLYGPNGGGKTSTVHALMMMTNPPASLDKVVRVGLRDDTEIVLEFNDVKLVYAKNDYCFCHGECRGCEERGARAIPAFWERVGVKDVGYLGDVFIVYSALTGNEKVLVIGDARARLFVGDLSEFGYWSDLFALPLVFGERFEVLSDIRDVTGIDYIYRGLAYRNEVWYMLNAEAAGYKRAILALILARHSDMAIIEGFENYLHIDLAVNLINKLDETTKYTVIETHLGTLLRWAIVRGWNVYYIDKGTSKKLQPEDLGKLELYRRELQVYGV